VNCAKCADFDRFCAKICKQCLQTASASWPPASLPGLRPPEPMRGLPSPYLLDYCTITPTENSRHRHWLNCAKLERNVTPPDECHYNTLLCCDYFSSSNVVLRAFSALRMYSKFRHHPRLLGYLCANFRFFRSCHC